MRKNSCLPGHGRSLCQICGTNINTEDVNFSRQEKNLVYMDKVYSYDQVTTCPLLSCFVSNPNNSIIELTLERPAGRNRNRNDRFNCCCDDDCRLDENAVFNIERSYVLVESFNLACPNNLNACQVSVDGISVDALSFNNGQFSATTNNLIPQIAQDRCQELSLPTKAFFLITDAGPWAYRATFVLEGTVNTGGRTCCFQAKVKTTDCLPRTVNGASNFALPNLSLPCIVNGTAPVINFQFSGGISMLNPELGIVCCGGNCCIVLETNLVVEPMINVEVVRKTLFCVDACEGMLPCDGTEVRYETEEEDCVWPPAPACACGTAISPLNDSCIVDRGPICNFEDDRFVRHGCGCAEPEAESGCESWDSCNNNFVGGASSCNGFRGCNGCAW